MSIMSNPTQRDPERAFALQKYLILHSQHDALQKRFDEVLSSYSCPPTQINSVSTSPDRYRHLSFSSTSSSDDGMPSTSPPHVVSFTRNHHRGGSLTHAPSNTIHSSRRSRALSMPIVADEATLLQMEEDESKLKDVNQQIKATLTELLNCESVKNDRKYRMWVQSRLMDAEKELKNCRTRSCERIRRRSEEPVENL